MCIHDAPGSYTVNPRPDGSVLLGSRGHGYEKWTDFLALDPTKGTSDEFSAFPEYRDGLLGYVQDKMGM